MSMLLAYIEKDPCKRLHITDYKKELHAGKLYCGYGHAVVGKQGEKKTWHFAHVSAVDSDCARNMGDWHHWWQDRVEPDFLELVMMKGATRHIADMINGDEIVVEFQKSVIPKDMILERENFYDRMIWVVCCSENHGFTTVKQRGRFIRLRMQRGSKFFLDMTKQTFLDFDMKGVIEVIKYINKGKSKTEVIGKIWTQAEFDDKFMAGCLRPDVDRRVHRPPYIFQEIDEPYAVVEKYLLQK